MTALAKISDRFVETDIDSEIVIMRLDSGEFFSLAGTGAAIWRLIDGVRDRGALLHALIDEFDGEPREIAADLDEFVLQLKGTGLLAG